MSVTPGFATFVIEQLGRVAPQVRSRKMFGGVGIYSAGFFFALIDDDVLYLKVDDSNRPDFQARGMGPFQPGGPGGEIMQYFRLPEELLDDVDELRPWIEQAILVAQRARKPRRRKPSH